MVQADDSKKCKKVYQSVLEGKFIKIIVRT